MTTTTASPRPAVTDAELHPLLAGRWSTRAFDPAHALSAAQTTALLEAARWTPSASNTQPWRFAVTHRGTPAHEAVLATLAPGNQTWADAASAFVVAAAVTVGPDGDERPWAVYDTGQAVAHLTVQAEHEGLAVHQIGGFDRAALAAVLDGPAAAVPLVVLAVGRHDPTVALPEPFASRETAERTRLPLASLVVEVRPAA
ncbi:nitroreductase family protein [Aquipuribacter hungaricus]|uniref:Nitroreductase family protein n=1 Tax=Aquipuribacter hungaricus TaxID=545624 RepID=A0ABV7WHS8_9MICO